MNEVRLDAVAEAVEEHVVEEVAVEGVGGAAGGGADEGVGPHGEVPAVVLDRDIHRPAERPVAAVREGELVELDR